MATITQLTPAAAGQALQSDGAAALGLTAPLLSPVWAGATPTFQAAALTVTFAGNVQMPFLGILETVADPSDVFDLTGNVVPGPITRVRLHPQAGARLHTIAAGRYSTPGAAFHHPVATQMVLRAATGSPLAPQWWEPGDDLGLSGVVSFHDRRGLIVDPVAVAAMYADILTAQPALLSLSGDAPDSAATVASPGGLNPIRSLATGTTVHVVNPHGSLFTPAVAARTITRRIGTTVSETLGAGGLISLPAGQTLQTSQADDAAATDPADAVGPRLRWGWSNAGLLARTPLAAPSLPGAGSPVPSLPRQFLRLTVVDLPWHVLGNRSSSVVDGIPADDGDIPAPHQPKVRADLQIDYLGDGVGVLGAARSVIDRMTGAGAGSIIAAASPTIDAGVGLPPAGDATGRWPAFPAPDTGAGFPSPVLSPATGLTATWTTGNDVVVTIADGQVPDGASVRIFPQQFVAIEAIAEAPSFLRGDGGAGIAASGSDLAILLPNPLRLLQGQPRPSGATLTIDVVVAPRTGERRLFANISTPIVDGPAAAPPDPFAAPDLIGMIPVMFRAIAPVPLFGLERAAPSPGGAPTSPVDLVRALASESEPREGPRLPTQARFDTIVVSGIADAAAAAGELRWSAVVTGGRWARETRSARHRDGNPGNPPGPDVLAAGVRVGGDLALDAARHVARRVQPIIPLPGSPGTSPGWIVMMGGNNFNDPSVSNPTDATGPNAGAGALLETVAAVCETPELSLTTFPLPDEAVVFSDILADAAGALGLPPPALTIGNEDRLANEVVKEFHHSRHGTRDALWSLRRSLGQARELVYIESPQFARTARPGGAAAAHEIDLVQVLAERMAAQPSLKVVVCVPKEGDFDPRYRGWVRQSIAARQEAIAMLVAIDSSRVAAFHPKGFPGRSAQIRSTTVIVDDCWAMVGTSHFRRRGMTFDGGADIVSIPYALTDGYARNLSIFRQELMAGALGLDPTQTATLASPEWTRMADPAASFHVFADLLEQDGAGMITPIWPGPTDTAVLPATNDMADPDGADGAGFIVTFAGLLAETGD